MGVIPNSLISLSQKCGLASPYFAINFFGEGRRGYPIHLLYFSLPSLAPFDEALGEDFRQIGAIETVDYFAIDFVAVYFVVA
jgi:hypothetical protein